MTATTLNSIIFRDIFTTAEMRQVFSDENRTACYLEIEAALARVQGRLGIIPQEAAREIDGKCKVENIDFAKLKATTERIGYPILGVVQQIVALCDKGLGEWCHWGATTQDITDTATIMQIRQALDLVEADMERVAAALADLARRYRDTADGGPQQSAAGGAAHLRLQVRVPARRHAAPSRTPQGAAPARSGRRVRGRGRHAGVARRDGLKVQEGLMVELKLGQPEIAWHTVRDRIGEVGCFLGLLTGTLGKISMDVKLLMQTEVAEVFEPFHEGRGSSSHHAAEAQPDLRRSTSIRPRHWFARTRPRCSRPRSPTMSARPDRGRSNGSRCRRSSCSAPARCGRPATWSRACRSTPRACARTSI